MELTAPPDPSGDGKGKARVGEERRRQKGGLHSSGVERGYQKG